MDWFYNLFTMETIQFLVVVAVVLLCEFQIKMSDQCKVSDFVGSGVLEMLTGASNLGLWCIVSVSLYILESVRRSLIIESNHKYFYAMDLL